MLSSHKHFLDTISIIALFSYPKKYLQFLYNIVLFVVANKLKDKYSLLTLLDTKTYTYRLITKSVVLSQGYPSRVFLSF